MAERRFKGRPRYTPGSGSSVTAGQAELALRVRQLSETRTEALDTGAAEIRRIERDLHDGAQARLVAMGMTLDTPMRIHLASELYGRPPAPVESAAYFAVSELLANVSKHAEARQTWIDIRHTDGTLRIGVTDNGHGGADPALRGEGRWAGGCAGSSGGWPR